MLDSMQADRVILSDLEAQILDLTRSLSALRAEHALVQKRLDAYKYPVLTLPNEIASEIFLHFLPIYPDAPPLTGLASPTSLTHVCRRWREVALATPALWKAIELVNSLVAPKQMRRIADSWIQRSGSCPLSIRINSGNRYLLNEIFTPPLAIATARWEHLKLHVPQSFLPTIVGSMPMLRSLHFSATSTYGADPFTLYDVPRLCTVNLYRRANVNLPWLQLTSLNLTCVEANDCVRILVQTLNLVQCILLLSDVDELEVPTSDLALPSLKSLVLETDDWTAAEEFLQSFVVPSLCSLQLEEEFLGDNPIPALASFISKCGCKLQEVQITECSTNQKSYRSAFPFIPAFSCTSTCEETTDEDGSED
ncbi:hypothetical protein C8R45DRAFT_294337 [Mycena sanguinolenta]|nr:hypothetical protein C8R45DRAFT_294337 [Mycena sanguinolenta]